MRADGLAGDELAALRARVRAAACERAREAERAAGAAELAALEAAGDARAAALAAAALAKRAPPCVRGHVDIAWQKVPSLRSFLPSSLGAAIARARSLLSLSASDS